MLLRRTLLQMACLFVASATAMADTTPPPMTVYKSPSCGCCAKWVDYLRDNGFEVDVIDAKDLGAVKRHYGVRPQLASCHTAVIDGYVIEGHVPVDDIRRLLAERPPIVGLTAPGMPQLSPGMRSLVPRDYDVLGFDRSGKTTLFSRY